MNKVFILIPAVCLLTASVAISETTPESATSMKPWNARDYSFGFWKNGWRKNKDDRSANVLCFETGYFGMSLDLANLTTMQLGLFTNETSYAETVQTGTARIDPLSKADFLMEIESGGTRYRAVTCQAQLVTDVKNLKHARLWESGKLVQHFDLLGVVFEDHSGNQLPCDATLDMVIWPESVTFNLTIKEAPSPIKTYLAVNSAIGDWKAEGESTTTLTCNFNTYAPQTDEAALSFTRVKQESYPVNFEPDYNCYVARLPKLKRSWETGYTDIRNYDEFDLVIDNKTGASTIPFLLNMSSPANITGLCPILCYEDGTPTGIPVQLSKNWHDEQLGSYLRAYAMIPAPKGQTKYRLRIVYGFYGTLPSATHSQLSLVGWGSGSNGRWCQLAIGCWGETICFDSDMSATDVMITDVRLLMARKGEKGRKWGWTDAGWGGDWMNLSDAKGQKHYFNDLKTAYISQGPCLTEVQYHGFYGSQQEVKFKSTVRTLRTDDYARTFQTFRYTFNKPVSATEGWLFKMGRSSRAVTPKVAYGNSSGLIKEKKVPERLREGETHLERVEITGSAPWWISFPGSYVSDTEKGDGSRSLIIRSYRAKIGKQIYTTPSFSTMAYKARGDGPNMDLLLTPPMGINDFTAGDILEFEVEWLTHPREEDDYYGPNESFRKHLKNKPKSWETVYREASGNDLKIQVAGASLKKSYPIILEATRPDNIQMKITGGVGMVPVRFEKLKSPDYELYLVAGGKQQKLDQSVHGNDFWQTDYDPVSGTYALTYNLPLDNLKTSGWLLKAK